MFGKNEPVRWPRILTLLGAWVGELRESKNPLGKPNKSGTPSKTPRKIDDSTWEVTVHVNTAEETRQVTERYELTLQQQPGENKWSVIKDEKVDEHVGLFRISGVECYPFETFSFDREGLKLSASNGSMCESYLEGEVFFFGVHAEGMTYEYAPPEHAGFVPTGHDYYAIHELISRDHSNEMGLSPVAYWVSCDKHSCGELIESSFTGLTRAAKDRRSQSGLGVAALPDWASAPFERWRKERREDPFAPFRPLDFPGNHYYSIFVARDLKPLSYGGTLDTALPGSGVVLEYNHWGGWEVQFSVYPKRIDLPEQAFGPLYGYFSEETLETSDPYELERRNDLQSRWFEVRSVNGVVELAIEDSETISADLEFGLTLREDVDELPFFINSQRPNSTFGAEAPAPLFVNSVRLDGEELTWVKTGSSTGRVILPERKPAGSELEISMSYTTRGIINHTHSYSYLNRFGWMPFVGFGDFIDEFDMIVKLPAKNEILGVGHKVSEEVQDGVRISHWRAEQPVVFPTIIFGRYKADRPRFEATKADGTVIPIGVHVDDASFVDWGILPKSLRPIAEQAANAINLYREVSGLDYPYGELNLVNDPKGFLYGQAPSSLIFLGSGVFRGEGFLAPFFNNATGIAKFLKSVVAHEVGHQWWGSRVANANSRNYWFVESLAEYFSAIYLEAAFGWKEYEEQVDEWRRAIVGTRMKTGVQNASSL